MNFLFAFPLGVIKLVLNRFLIFSISISSVYLWSCEGILKLELTGDGNIIVQKRYINSINEVELTEDFLLEIIQSDTRKLKVEADSNLMSYIETIVEKEKLIIQRKSNFALSPRKQVKITLMVEGLEKVVATSGIIVCDTLNFNNFEINSFGSANVTSRCITSSNFYYYTEGGTSALLNGCFGTFKIRQLGSAESTLSGSAENLQIVQEGSGKVEAYKLQVPDVSISLFGSGLVFCNATEQLKVVIKGKGRVYFVGNPSVISNIEGGGALIQEEE